MIFISELAYSLHLGSDKNRKNVSREKTKTNNSGTTSLPNSAIQNASHLTRVDKHNYRKYDDKQDDIVIVRGTDSLVNDVKNLYIQEFQKAVDEYNSKELRKDRHIQDYFTKISNNDKNDSRLSEKEKQQDQLSWVGLMNNYKSCAEEIVLQELIYN